MMLRPPVLICLSIVVLLFGVVNLNAQELYPFEKSEFAVIDDIVVRGNEHIKDGKITKQLTLSENRWYNFIDKKERITERVIQYQQGLVDSLYHVNGFLDASSRIWTEDADEPGHVVLMVEITEGEQTFIGNVRMEGGVGKTRKQARELLKGLKKGHPYNHMEVKETAYRIRSHYANNGYAYCEVEPLVDISPDRKTANIVIKVSPGKQTYFGEITLEGLTYTRPEVVRRELQFKTGDLYDEGKILESHRYLYSSELFNYVSVNPQYHPETQSPPDIHISLKERKPNYFSLGTGAGQSQQRDLILNASLEYRNRNLFGTGRKFGLGVISSFEVITRQSNFSNEFITSYTEPWLFLVRMPFEIKLSYAPNTKSATQDYVFDRYSLSFSITRELARDIELKFTEDFQSINIQNIPSEQEAAFREEKEIKLRRKFISSLRADKRDNILVPTKGYLTQITVEYVGGVQGGDIDFVKLGGSWNRYQVFMRSNVFASRLQFNWLREFGDTRVIPIEDRFFMGGASTMRGYKENDLGPKNPETGNPSGGKLSILGNFEIRRPLYWRFGGTVFTDIGNLWEKPEDFNTGDLKLTAGAGIQFFTPIGPIRFDYAFRVIRNGDDPGGQYHISILYIF